MAPPKGLKKAGVASAANDTPSKRVRPSKEWAAIDLEAQYPEEFRHTPLACSALFVGVMTIYVLTMHPSVSGGDNGELLGCACELGVAHPPGYPTFTMLGWVFVKILPFGTPAFRVGVMSAGIQREKWVLDNCKGSAAIEESQPGIFSPRCGSDAKICGAPSCSSRDCALGQLNEP